jgi:hypothetical protein
MRGGGGFVVRFHTPVSQFSPGPGSLLDPREQLMVFNH